MTITPGTVALIVSSHLVMLIAMVVLVGQVMRIRSNLENLSVFIVKATAMYAGITQAQHDELIDTLTEEVSDEVRGHQVGQ
jgi:hypothetical protein